MTIHPLAAVSPEARIGRDVHIGPFSVIEGGATIGDGCRLASHVIVKQGTTLGSDNNVAEGAVLGGMPQHVRRPEHPGVLVIGSSNTIREYVTMHRALTAEHATTIGNANLIMINAHVAHDCHLGDNTIVANNVMIAGHVTVEDKAYISGAVGVHQFCRIGRLAMVGGQAHVNRDIPPFVTVDGASGQVVGLNLIGLKRSGFSPDDILELKAAYRLIYRSGLKWSDIIERLGQDFATGPAAEFHKFLSCGTRGFVQERRMPATTTIKLPTASSHDGELKAKAG